MGNHNILPRLPSPTISIFSMNDRPNTSTREQHSTSTITNPIMYNNSSIHKLQSFATRNIDILQLEFVIFSTKIEIVKYYKNK